MGSSSGRSTMFRMFCVLVAVAFAVFTPGEVQGADPEQTAPNAIVPEQQFAQGTAGCSMHVKTCFAHVKKEAAPVWKKPVSDFSGSYKTMCSAEITVKLSEKSEKEMAFKAVREGKQKMKIVYVNKLPKKAKKAKKKATKHHKKVVKKHHKKVVKKVHKVHPKVVVKKKTHKKKKLHVSSLKEVLIKTGEQSHKAQLKS